MFSGVGNWIGISVEKKWRKCKPKLPNFEGGTATRPPSHARPYCLLWKHLLTLFLRGFEVGIEVDEQRACLALLGASRSKAIHEIRFREWWIGARKGELLARLRKQASRGEKLSVSTTGELDLIGMAEMAELVASIDGLGDGFRRYSHGAEEAIATEPERAAVATYWKKIQHKMEGIYEKFRLSRLTTQDYDNLSMPLLRDLALLGRTDLRALAIWKAALADYPP